MKTPIEWLAHYVDIEDIDPNKLLERLIMTGSNIEQAFNVTRGIEGVVVGRIESIERHPDADKLVVCSVDLGSEKVQIVTAARNVSAGDVIPVATHGSTIAGGVRIKKGKLRGVESNGMLCSLAELGFAPGVIPEEFVDGILLLGEEYADQIGRSAIEALRLDRDVIEFEITPNRPDCLSIVGMARETAAALGRSLKDIPGEACGSAGSQSGSGGHAVSIETPDCLRYVARRVRNAVVKPSPLWMQIRLMQAGMRPINNIVDITNYVNLELGNPVHAFDLSRLDGGITVRRARRGEKLTTLDGVERQLDEEMMVIADSSRALGIAGVMGGEESGIHPDTTDILIEVAAFDKASIRRTSKKLGLRSEASARFEKGVSADWCRIVSDRVCRLIEQLGAGEIESAVTDVYPSPQPETVIPCDPSYIRSRIGVDIDPELELSKLGIRVKDGMAHIPHFRLDLRAPIDLVEEVARMYGYDRLPETLPHNEAVGHLPPREEVSRRLYLELAAQGVSEIQTYSFASPSALDTVRPADEPRVRVRNPLGEEFSVLRTTLIPNMLDVVRRNLNRKNFSFRLFELGTVFAPHPGAKLPDEPLRLTICAVGRGEDFFTLKGVVEELSENLRIRLRFDKERRQAMFHPGKCAAVKIDSEDGAVPIGYIGELSPKLLAGFDIDEPVYLADLDFDAIVPFAQSSVVYRAIPVLPAVERDIALIAPDEVSSGAIEEVIRGSSGRILESVEFFDLYRGPQIGEGFKSIAYALRYRSDRQLTDKDVNKSFDRTVAELEKTLGVKLRDK